MKCLVQIKRNHPPLAGGSNALARSGRGVKEDPSPAKTKDLLRKPKFLRPLPQGERVVLFAFLIFLAACTFNKNPQMPSREAITPGQTITVDGSKNIYAIAQENRVSMRSIIVLNNLQPPFTLRPGQTLVLPAANGMTPGYNVGNERGLAPPPNAVPSAAIESVELAPVQSAPLTPMQAVPPAQQPKQTQSGVLGAPVASAPVEDLNKPAPAPKHVETTVPQPHTAPPAPVAETAAPAATIEMRWPVQGPVLSTFGPKGQGLNNDGVNIGAPKGTPVVAAANGMVVYAGNEMKGFGNLILIRHANGWVTAYAHLDRTLVAKDSVVAQGDMIGTVGKTGNVPSPQLHFETRQNGKPVDPQSFIKAQ